MVGDRSNTPMADGAPARPQRDVNERRICIKCKGRIVFLGRDEIRWIEAAGNHLNLHTDGETYVIRDTMATFATIMVPIEVPTWINAARPPRVRDSPHASTVMNPNTTTPSTAVRETAASTFLA